MELDAAARQLAIEVRDGEALKVSYALLDLDRPALLWDELVFESGWLSGLSGLKEGYMLFHTYEDPQDPEKKGVFAYDVASEEVSWAYSGYSHLGFWQGSSIGVSRQGEEREYAQITLSTGDMRMLSREEGLLLLEKEQQENREAEKAYAYPLQYAEDSPHLLTVQAFLRSCYGVQAVQECEYLEIVDKIIISYYTANREMLSNYILVCNKEGEELLHVCMNKAGEGTGLDTFFVAGSKLIFTKEKRIIESYEI